MSNENHSIQNLVEIQELIDINRHIISHKGKCKCRNKLTSPSSIKIAERNRHNLLKNEDVYGKESISRKRVERSLYGSAGWATNLKFKSAGMKEWTEAFGRTMGVRVRAIAAIALLLALAAGSAAAPAHSRSSYNDKHVVSTYITCPRYSMPCISSSSLKSGSPHRNASIPKSN